MKIITVYIACSLCSCGDYHDISRGKWVIDGKAQVPTGIAYSVRNYDSKESAGYYPFTVIMKTDEFQLGDELTVCKKEAVK